ncbi:MAG: VOC family protein [Porphyromonadaceae bacterium]|nr:VOC family protein [Porphyromonadaceae bacterium]
MKYKLDNMNIFRAVLIIPVIFFGTALFAQRQGKPEMPKRPRLLGLAHVAFATDDFANSRRYFSDYLGYAEVHELKRPDEKGDTVVWMTAYKVNDDQVIELFPENPKRRNNENKLMHIGFLTDDAEAMRVYLASKGCKVPAQVNKGKYIDNLNFFVYDPNGVAIEIVQYPRGGLTDGLRGNDLLATRLSRKISHVGFSCYDVDKAFDFYFNILGFTELWRHGPTPEKVGWVHLKFPDSDQTIELMLSENEKLSKSQLGSQNHICLVTNDIKTVETALAGRVLPSGCTVAAPTIGKNDHKRQLNTRNIDGTRIEFMEDHSWDGSNPSSSTGKLMRKQKKQL